MHLWLTWFWVLIGTAFTAYLAQDATWMEVFIAAISVYANIATHWSAYQGARAEAAAKAK
jgi:hypothetical protein